MEVTRPPNLSEQGALRNESHCAWLLWAPGLLRMYRGVGFVEKVGGEVGGLTAQLERRGVVRVPMRGEG
jgi:hypothetical protein